MKRAVGSLLMIGAFFCAGSAQAADDIALDRVILSTSGLAQFEHRAKVTGNAELTFPVRLDQVDDILKSMVVFDPKGRLGGVTLPGRQPLDQVFKDLPFNRGQLASAMMLLNAYQGAVLTARDAYGTSTGKILQVVPEQTVTENDKTVTRHRLSLMTETGIKQAVLEELQAIEFSDKKVREEILRALDAIRENSTAGRRDLTVHLQGGEGERDVALSYVVSSPLWKTAYRLVVPEAGGTKGLLQGWAVVENMTAGDWKDVELTLVSGNPVTFRQALYSSYYVERPEIPVKVFGLVLPRMDEGTIATAGEMQAEEKELAPQKALMKRGRALYDAPAAAPAMEMAMDAVSSNEGLAMPMGMDQMSGLAQAAQSAEATTQVLFRFPDRFSLKAGQSLMVPFVSRDVPMEKVSVYQPETNAKHPLAAVEVSNDGDSGLPPGVLTLYEETALLKGTSFVGDAQMPALSQGEKRLVSYALDSKTTVDRADKSASTEGRITAERGVIRTAVLHRLETNYTVKAPPKEARTVVIEHPRMGGDYKVVEPDPKNVEVTDTHYRLRVALKEGETKQARLVLESTLWQSWGIADLSADDLKAYASGRGELPTDVRAQFSALAILKREVADIDQKIGAVDEQRRILFEDQTRVRENLKSLGVESDVQKKYLDKLNAQEDEVTKLDQQRAALAEQRQVKWKELQDKIAALSF